MPEPITRRQFLSGSALVAGAAAIFDPTWLFGSLAADPSAPRGQPPQNRPGRRGSDGPSAQVEYGDGDSAPLVRWTRLGEDHILDLWSTEIVIDVPTISETAAIVSLADFEQGRGHHEVVHFFGAPTLEQLRTEVAYRSVLIQWPGQQAA